MSDLRWDSLARHADLMRGRTVRELFAAEPYRDRMHVEAAGWYFDYGKHRVDAETLELLFDLATERGLKARIDAMFAGEHVNVTEDRAVLHTALRMPAGTHLFVDGVDVVVEVHKVLRSHVVVRDIGPRGRLGRSHRPADPQRGEHRDRRQRSRSCDGVRRAARVQPARYAVPVRVERRRRRPHRRAARSRCRGDAVHHLVEDVHDARDAHQRARGAGVAGRRAGRRRARGREALRRGLDERGKGVGVRDRHFEHVRVLGLGRGPLLDVVGDRLVGHARRRARQLPRAPRGRARDGRALPHRSLRGERAGADGSAYLLVPRLPRRAVAGRRAVRERAGETPVVPAAARDGEQREVGPRRRLAGRRAHRRDRVGHGRHQWSARLLSAFAPGHDTRADRFHRLRHSPARPRARQPAGSAEREPLRAGGGTRVRDRRSRAAAVPRHARATGRRRR